MQQCGCGGVILPAIFQHLKLGKIQFVCLKQAYVYETSYTMTQNHNSRRSLGPQPRMQRLQIQCKHTSR